MKWKHVIIGISLAILTGMGGEGAAYTPVYLNGNTNYPLVYDMSLPGQDYGKTGLFLDVSSITVTDATENEIDLAALLLEVHDGTYKKAMTADFKLDADGQYWTKNSQTGQWVKLPDHSDDPSAIAAMLIRQDMASAEHRQKYEDQLTQILYAKKKAQEQKGKTEAVQEGNTKTARTDSAVTADSGSGTDNASKGDKAAREDSASKTGSTVKEGNASKADKASKEDNASKKDSASKTDSTSSKVSNPSDNEQVKVEIISQPSVKVTVHSNSRQSS